MAQENKSNESVGLFLRAMVDREPGKRKVKPSKTALIDLAELELGESSDDSDFNVDEARLKEDDDISINSDMDDDDEEDDDDDDNNSLDGNKDPLVDVIKASSIKDRSNLSVSQLIAEAETKQSLALEQDIKRPKMLVCAVCLAENSDDANEIVTCDGCHISVHEGCYGISDVISVSSTVSSSSTEPWFCDACKAGISNPNCELCPNLGYSIFKETEMGRWVHLVCALYIPGVAFSEVDKLSFPTLFEMPYSRYGAKCCSLCEDDRFCKTGVCIGCDAGMCRAHFHVTCAQREGLLSEVNHYEADQADPYYAHCKLHTDKELMKRRRRNWVALQLHMKEGQRSKNDESSETKERLLRKLTRYREKYALSKANRPPPWRPTQKLARPLSTSASLFRSLMHKTSLMGIDCDSNGPDIQFSIGDVRKKWHIAPAFSVEFISYFLDRNSRMKQMKEKLTSLMKENEYLASTENNLRNRFQSLRRENQKIDAEGAELLNKSLEMHDILKGLAGRPLRLPPVVAALHNPPVVSNLGESETGKEKRLITKAATKMMTTNIPSLDKGVSQVDSKQKTKLAKNSQNGGQRSEANVLRMHSCGVCNLTKDQHQLIECDTCIKFYHLSCLDPPLTRMPKKTKQMGWQCSECCKSSDSDRTPEVDIGGPRRLRRVGKEINIFSPSLIKKNGSCRSKGKGNSKMPKATLKRRRNSDSKSNKGNKVRRRSLDFSPKEQSSISSEVKDCENTSCNSSEELSAALVESRSNSSSNGVSSTNGETFSSPITDLLQSDEANLKREHRHRHEGARKKHKRDRDKEENRRKHKHHHRHHKFPVGDIPFPFKLKIKPLPPRPAAFDSAFDGSEGEGLTVIDQLDLTPSHTTSTTTAPPGYPPLPPGYTLTQPLMVTTTTDTPQENSSLSTQRVPEQNSVCTVSSASTLPPKGVPINVNLSSNGPPSTVGRRKSDSGAAKQFSTCDVCGEAGGVTNTVVCDECLKAYHFNCLDPPLKKSPKRRGYSWFCEDCDTASSSSSASRPSGSSVPSGPEQKNNNNTNLAVT